MMNDALKMQISAFVDGELPENESELLLRRLGQDAVLRQQVSHYLHIGRLARREPEIRGMELLRGRIAESLGEVADEPATFVPAARSRYTRLMAGGAIAAAVALLALFGLQQVDVPVAPDTGVTEYGVASEQSGENLYTVPELDDMQNQRLLGEMRRQHDDDILSRVVSYEIQGRELRQVEPVSQPLEDDADADSVAEDPSGDLAESRQAE